MQKKLFIVVNQDWFFLSHRLPIGVAAKEASYDVTIVSEDTGVSNKIREAGLKIPDAIAIASVDNTVESAYTRPPLTTVNIPKYEMGVLAFQKLHRLIEGQDTIPVKTVVYGELIVRESCGGVRRRVGEG